MVQLRLIGSLMLAVSSMEDEYFHTQLLQTRLAVEDKTLTPEKAANVLTEAFEKHYFFARAGQPGRPCAQQPHCKGACDMHYGDDSPTCCECADKFQDKSDPEYQDQQEMREIFQRDPDQGMKMALGAMSNCTGTPDLVASKCGDQNKLFSCVMCSHQSQNRPDDSPEFKECVDGWEKIVDMMKQRAPPPTPPPRRGGNQTGGPPRGGNKTGGPPPRGNKTLLIQRQVLVQPSQEDLAKVCGHMWPDATPEDCAAATGAAVERLSSPDLCADLTMEEIQDCFVDEIVDAMSSKMDTEDAGTKACKQVLGDEVDVDLCYEAAMSCDSCDWDISDECKKCVGDVCEGGEGQAGKCKKSSEDLLLSVKHHPSSRTMFVSAHSKQTFGKMLRLA